MPLRIGVMGAGAVGCYVGGLLADRGYPVTLVGRPRVCGEVSNAGLVLTSLEQRSRRIAPQQLTVATEAQPLAHVDVVLVATKSGQTREAGEQLRTVLPSHTIVASMQNGLRNADLLRSVLPEHQVLACIVGFNVRSLGDGRFRQSTTGPLIFEASAAEQMAELVTTLGNCGLDVEQRRDIRALQWTKLILNLNNALSALSGAPTQELLFNARYRKLLRAVMREALSVLRTAKVRPGRLGALPASMFPWVLGLPTFLLRWVLRAQLRVDPHARSSMWEDLARGRSTEVDELNGAIVQLAAAHGCDAPLNRRIVAVVHEFEARRMGSPTLSAERLLEVLGMHG